MENWFGGSVVINAITLLLASIGSASNTVNKTVQIYFWLDVMVPNWGYFQLVISFQWAEAEIIDIIMISRVTIVGLQLDQEVANVAISSQKMWNGPKVNEMQSFYLKKKQK